MQPLSGEGNRDTMTLWTTVARHAISRAPAPTAPLSTNAVPVGVGASCLWSRNMRTNKPCRVCKAIYSPNPGQYRNGDYLCKECRAAKGRRDRLNASPETRERKRMWNRNHDLREYEQRPEVKKRRQRYRQSHPEHFRAYVMLRTARRRGTVKARPCMQCGATPADAHHEDYERPLDVMWLCRTHHRRRHMV